MTQPLLAIEDPSVGFRTPRGTVLANKTLSLTVAAGETLGIVGESGSGKSVLCRAILRLLPSPPAEITAKSLRFEGRDLLKLKPAEMRSVRGQDIAMVFQNPMTSLNPVWPIGDPVSEGLRVHRGLSSAVARKAAIDILERVGIPS